MEFYAKLQDARIFSISRLLRFLLCEINYCFALVCRDSDQSLQISHLLPPNNSKGRNITGATLVLLSFCRSVTNHMLATLFFSFEVGFFSDSRFWFRQNNTKNLQQWNAKTCENTKRVKNANGPKIQLLQRHGWSNVSSQTFLSEPASFESRIFVYAKNSKNVNFAVVYNFAEFPNYAGKFLRKNSSNDCSD